MSVHSAVVHKVLMLVHLSTNLSNGLCDSTSHVCTAEAEVISVSSHASPYSFLKARGVLQSSIFHFAMLELFRNFLKMIVISEVIKQQYCQKEIKLNFEVYLLC